MFDRCNISNNHQFHGWDLSHGFGTTQVVAAQRFPTIPIPFSHTLYI